MPLSTLSLVLLLLGYADAQSCPVNSVASGGNCVANAGYYTVEVPGSCPEDSSFFTQLVEKSGYCRIPRGSDSVCGTTSQNNIQRLDLTASSSGAYHQLCLYDNYLRDDSDRFDVVCKQSMPHHIIDGSWQYAVFWPNQITNGQSAMRGSNSYKVSRASSSMSGNPDQMQTACLQNDLCVGFEVDVQYFWGYLILKESTSDPNPTVFDYWNSVCEGAMGTWTGNWRMFVMTSVKEPPTSSIVQCPTGTTSLPGATSAQDCVNPCSAGSYGPGGSSCSSCPAGSTSAAGATTISDCYCLAGYRGSGGSCTACQYNNNEYQPSTGQSSCLQCPANRSPTGNTATACQCDPGYTGSSCSACTEGKYKASTGSGGCTECPVNTQSGSASDNVNDCECMTGTTAGSNGQACSECETGKYKAFTGAGSCVDCGSGGTTLSPRSDDQGDCVPDTGYTGPAGGSFSACATGTYKTAPGVSACTPCFAHATSPSASTSIDACSCVAPAYVDDPDGADECDCAAGYYYQSNACVPCEANNFCPGGPTSGAAQTSCASVLPDSVSAPGSTAEADCECSAGFKTETV